MPEALRPYQVVCVEQARAALAAGRHPVVVVPTGGGKTHVGAEIVRRATTRGRRVLWLAHRKELVEQAAERLRRFDIACGIIMAGYPEDREQLVQVASIQSLVRRDAFDAQLVIVDEAHHIRAKTYQSVLEALPGVPLIGLTATPRRLDGKGLGQYFAEIVAPVSVQDLVDMGALVLPIAYAPSNPDLRGIRKARGDYEIGALNTLMQDRHLVGDVVQHYLRVAAGRRGILFACGIEHSQSLVAEFTAAGVRAAHLDGETPRAEREDMLRRLRDGELDIVSNVGVLTEGYDLPALEVAIIARPTASWALHTQMIGRIMRPKPDGGACILLDHAGNISRHGLPDEPVEHSLADEPEQQPDRPAEAGPRIRVCRQCYAVMAGGASHCPVCQTVPAANITVDVHAGELVQVTRRQAAANLKTRKAERYLALAEEASAKGYRLGWASNRYRQEFGVWPRGDWFRVVNRMVRERCQHVKRDGRICVFCFDGAATFGEFMGA